MKKINIDPRFFTNNRAGLSAKLKPNTLALIIAGDVLTRNGDQSFPYRQGSDLFYFTGISQEKTILSICPDHPDEKLREVIFSIEPDETLETWTGHKLTKKEIETLSGVKTVKWLSDFEMTLRDMALHAEHICLNLNEYAKYQTDLVYSDYRLATEVRRMFPAHQYYRLAPLITALRLVKKPEEIELLKKACEITGAAFRRILKFVRPAIWEYEVEAEITHEFISQGAAGHAYQPIVGSGKNALVLHYIENSDVCREGDLLLMDFGAEYGNYAADCSRTIPVNGTFTPRQKACYEAVLRVQKEAEKLFIPGNTIDEVNKVVWKMMEKEMIKLDLFKDDDVQSQNPERPLYFKYLMHGVTHFIGLDVHDVGGKYQPFEEGMVLTLEPGIYIQEENIGIRIENNIMVGNPPVDLMASIPREPDEIEALMRK
ncbi:MAG: aminopeptidase P N-terminal domain-containing protein [Bacteroidales bacterium]